MERGAIDVASLPGGLDLQATVESGQSYLWWRADGDTYDGDSVAGGEDWYVTTTRATPGPDPDVVRARQREGRLEWEASADAEPVLRHRLGLDDDLDAIRDRSRSDELVDAAFDAFWGMRIVRDPPFPTLVTFICSAQMRVARIFGMQQALRETYGTPVEFDGETYHAFPTPAQLAEASEAELRDLGLGYRAPYVEETATMVADGVADPTEAAGREYEAAREYLTRFVGVGDKVADCVLLFSLGFLEAVPLDTWIRRTIGEYYPECDRNNYAETSRAIRETFGPDVAGYPQTYVFHYLRTGQRSEARAT